VLPPYPWERDIVIEFRWVTNALSGPWQLTRNLALLSAMQYGQATINRGKDRVITLRTFVSIEERQTDGKAAVA
jgi:hypothetical protein